MLQKKKTHEVMSYCEDNYHCELWYQNNRNDNHLFNYLILLNDPEAQGIFDKHVKGFIKTGNGADYILSVLEGKETAYSTKKIIEVLSKTTPVKYVAGYGTPFDYFMYRELYHGFAQHKMKIDNLMLGAYNMPDVKTCRKNKSKIIELAKELIKKQEAEEAYWKDNMPYDYVPDATFHP